ncbi:prepilin peptidase [Caldimonas caldifontis]|uniref:Prepilin leader peptidase/N-methyltransferase n=1 Tax=Caldimonas caldifontis TaxID=1452508 RepID=A0A2S5SSS5_9BURK|nr:A24 family peptidase [Caldimonas caldifontis]PPE65788.1 prepilin peptidase [Caldimonas caldifontis]
MSPDVLAWWLSPAALGILGLCVGSFLNVVIHRLPLMLERQWRRDSAELLEVALPDEGSPLSLVRPRSRCPQCGHLIRWYENIPVISWIALRARCSACKTPISARYPGVEVLTAALFAGVGWKVGPEPVALAWCAVMATLVALTFIDWDTTLLPDQLTQPLLWGGLIAAALGWTIPLPTALWGAVGGYLSLWSVYWLFKLTTGKEGMGFGDFKLLAALGAWLGWNTLLPIALIASVIGAIVGIGMKMVSSLREGRYVPFGPFLAGAGVFVYFVGVDTVLGWIGWY